MAKRNWIADAIGRPGALHKALNVPAGQKIPKGKVAKAAKSKNLTLSREARLAQTLSKFRKK